MHSQLTLIAKLTAKPEYADTLGRTLQGLVGPTRLEEGSIDYHVHRNNDDPNVWIIYENWRCRSRCAFRAAVHQGRSGHVP